MNAICRFFCHPKLWVCVSWISLITRCLLTRLNLSCVGNLSDWSPEQTERKSALTSTSTASGLTLCSSQPSSSLMRLKIWLSSTLSSRHSHSQLHMHSLPGRPSLDDVASGFEYRTQPSTPSRKSLSSSSLGYALWENMLSSPVEPPSNSPEATRVFVEFGISSPPTQHSVSAANIAGVHFSYMCICGIANRLFF